jgi:hypothetical protein
MATIFRVSRPSSTRSPGSATKTLSRGLGSRTRRAASTATTTTTPSRVGLLTSVCEHATINPWDGLPPLILCESRSLSGILRPLCDEYRCRLTATNGQARGFLVTEIAPILADNDRAVLYLGDLDHRGGQIEAHTQRVLEHETGRVFDWTRIAITEEQVAERGLTPTVKVDSAYRPPLEHDAWEAEALTQRVVVALVREALDLRLPQPLPDVQERERLEREALGDLLRESES